jgi:hypothetical protein
MATHIIIAVFAVVETLMSVRTVSLIVLTTPTSWSSAWLKMGRVLEVSD